MALPLPRSRADRAALAADALTGLVLVGTALWLGGVFPAWTPWGWGGLAAVLCIRLLDTETPWRWPALWLAPWLVWMVWLAHSHSGDREAAAREVENWIPLLLWTVVGASARRPQIGLGALGILAAFGSAVSLWQVWVQPGWLVGGRWQAEQYLGRASGTFGNPNQWAAFLVLVLPWVATVVGEGRRSRLARAAALWLALLSVVSLLLSQSRGVWLAALLVGVVWGLCNRRMAWIAGLVSVLGLVILVVGPWRERLETALAQRGETARIALWRAGAEAIQASPWKGVGPGGFNDDFEKRRPPGFPDSPQWAHSDALQVVWETGLVGAGILILGFAGLLWNRRASQRRGKPSGFSQRERDSVGWGVLAFAIASAVDFHWHIPGAAWPAAWLLGVWVGGHQAILQDSLIYKNKVGSMGGALALVIVFHAGGTAHSAARAEMARQATLRDWQRIRVNASLTPDVEKVLRAAERALRTTSTQWPSARAVWVSLAEVQGHLAGFPTDPGTFAVEAERSARQALSLSEQAFDGWLVLGVSLQRQGRMEEASLAFQEALRRAPRSPAVWYQFAYYLMAQPGGKTMARVAIENCLHLDPSHRGAQALQQKLSSLQ